MWHKTRVVGDRVQTDYSTLRQQRLEEVGFGCDQLRWYETADTPGGTYQEPGGFKKEQGGL
jgi:hypothetical protein